jgi:hypothetical protein
MQSNGMFFRNRSILTYFFIITTAWPDRKILPPPRLAGTTLPIPAAMVGLRGFFDDVEVAGFPSGDARGESSPRNSDARKGVF